MSDTASLIVRVSGAGVDSTAKSLDGLTAASGRADKANLALAKSSDAAAKSMPKAGMVAQSVGRQFQDMVVQIQGGQSAFVAIGQQVPQLLDGFGPAGAITGLVIALSAAVAGPLYNSMNQASTASDRLKDATKGLNDIITETDDGVEVLTERIIRLAQANETAARAEISLGLVRAKDVINAASDAIGNATKQVDGWTNTAGSLSRATNQLDDLERITQRFGITQLEAFDGNIPAAFQMKIEDLSVFMNTLGKEYGLTKAEALSFIQATDAFNKQRTPETAAALADNMARVATTSQTATPEFIKLTAEVGENARKMTDAKDKTDVLKSAQQNLVAAITQSTIAMSGNSRSLEGWVVSLENSVLRGKDALKAKRDQTVQDINNNAQLDEQQKARALKAAEDLYKLESSELDKREALRDQKHGVTLQKQENRDTEKLQRDRDSAAQYLTQLQQSNMSELELIDSQEQQKLAKIQEYRSQSVAADGQWMANGLITAQQYQDALLEIETNAKQARIDVRTQEIDEYYKLMGDARKADISAREKENAIKQKQLDDGIAAQRNMTGDLKSALGEQNALYKASAIITATISTYQSAATAMAQLPWPVNLVAAGAAVVAGLANVAAIKAAREQGGGMTAGSAYQMAERGKAEVIVPAGASRARTAAQMRDIMGQNGGSSPSSVVIVNQTTGRIDSVQQERTDEGQLRLIIREQMAIEAGDESSPFTKTRRATRMQPGFA